MHDTILYYDRLAASFVRGLNVDPELAYPKDPALRMDSLLEDLSPEELAGIVNSGIASGIRLHRFMRTTELPRVAKVISLLQGIDPTNLLDIGCGRGAFLWPLVNAFPKLAVTAVDKEETHVATVRTIARGGMEQLRGSLEDVTRLSFADGSFDVVTMLEVVEHVPEAMKALAEAVRVARRYVIISVPSREDEVPHHTHLFNPERLTEMLQLAGAARITLDRVKDHLIVIGRISRA